MSNQITYDTLMLQEFFNSFPTIDPDVIQLIWEESGKNHDTTFLQLTEMARDNPKYSNLPPSTLQRFTTTPVDQLLNDEAFAIALQMALEEEEKKNQHQNSSRNTQPSNNLQNLPAMSRPQPHQAVPVNLSSVPNHEQNFPPSTGYQPQNVQTSPQNDQDSNQEHSSQNSRPVSISTSIAQTKVNPGDNLLFATQAERDIFMQKVRDRVQKWEEKKNEDEEIEVDPSLKKTWIEMSSEKKNRIREIYAMLRPDLKIHVDERGFLVDKAQTQSDSSKNNSERRETSNREYSVSNGESGSPQAKIRQSPSSKSHPVSANDKSNNFDETQMTIIEEGVFFNE